MRRTVLAVTVVFLVCMASWAQETRHEVTVQGSGFFTKETSDLGITNKPTYSGGFLAGYRFNINQWLGVEGDYDYFSNSQKYINSTGTALVRTNVHAATGAAVVKIPTSSSLTPYFLAGGGAIIFDPRDTNLVETQSRGTFVYGGGVDLALTKRFTVRGQYRGFLYKTPDFEVSDFRTDKFTHTAVPSAGLVFTF
ncbi:MAG TPA: porin family protein [Terriglobales bacterium]|nr:porin family protein [Terriglobales bacterium]